MPLEEVAEESNLKSMEYGRYQDLVADLMGRRADHCFPLNLRTLAREFAEDVLAILFPHYSTTQRCDSDEVADEIERLEGILQQLLVDLAPRYEPPSPGVIEMFLDRLPTIYQSTLLDAKAIAQGDPAAANLDEVILCYPGFYGIAVHRIAHELWKLQYPLLPRLLSEHAHHRTGIDIHPGATIGRSFFIDHGTGVVVGETAEIGNGVKLYQGVTLGALAVSKSMAHSKRHPTIGDNVVIYANATILGGNTEVGHDSIVGGNAWVTESIPPFSIVGRNSEVRARPNRDDGDMEFNI